MKVYIFYLVDTDINETKYPAVCFDLVKTNKSIKSVLYAWTTKKVYRDEFKFIHNDKLFRESVINMSEEEFDGFSDYYDEFELNETELIIEVWTNGRQNVDGAKVLMTGREYEQILIFPSELMDIIWDYDNMNELYSLYHNKIFNDKILYILKNFYFIDDSLTSYVSEHSNAFMADDLLFDQMETYVYLYKNLLKG